MTHVLKRGDAQEAVRGWGRGWRDAAADAAAPGAERGRKDPPPEPPKAPGPDTWVLDIWPQNCKRICISVVFSPQLVALCYRSPGTLTPRSAVARSGQQDRRAEGHPPVVGSPAGQGQVTRPVLQMLPLW